METETNSFLQINRAILCEKKDQNESFMMCPMCDFFPCAQLSKEQILELNLSPLMDRRVVKFISRRCKLYIIKYLDGTLMEAPDLDPSNPDRQLMQNVDTVYQIGRELIPVIVLKPKPKEDRKKIIKKQSEIKRKA